VQYKIKNGLFTYHRNKQQWPFPLTDQKKCASFFWAPPTLKTYFANIDATLKFVKETREAIGKDHDGNTPLMLACWTGEPRLIKALLEITSDITEKNRLGEQALHMAAKSGRPDGLKFFLDNAKSIEINATDDAGWTAAHHVATNGNDPDLMRLLTDRGIDLAIKSTSAKAGFTEGMTAAEMAPAPQQIITTDIREAALQGQLDVVEAYLQQGGDPEMLRNGATILIDVARNMNGLDNTAEMVELLIDYGADINAVTQDAHFNALMMCINSAYNKGGRIPAFLNEYIEHVRIAKVLIDNGINLLQEKNGSNQRALRDAAEFSPEITTLIVERLQRMPDYQKELNQQDDEGFTALHTAARSGYLDIVKTLVTAGVDVNICENYGFLPLHEAIICGHYEIAKYLLEAGSDIDHKLKMGDGKYEAGDDAKAIARKSGNEKIVKLFG